MNEHLLLSLAAMVVLGIAAQWIAWRVGLPSILLLLLFGFAVGPAFRWIDPDSLLGEWLMPLVSLSVGLILFEGGLTLKFHELKTIAGVLRNLLTIGAGVTWILATVAARWLFGWDWTLALLIGAILVVTGPTVVMPLLRHVKPTRQVASTLKWEGILIDPLGALLALLVFEAIIAQETSAVPMMWVAGFARTLLVGGLLGIGAAMLLAHSFRRFWVPDYLQNPVALAVVVGAFTFSNQLQHESGLLTVTIMGIALANQKSVRIQHIVEFKENLRVLLISFLFILLSARLQPHHFKQLSLVDGLIFLGALVLVVRPLAVLLSSLRGEIKWKERAFLGWMAPRGIVAAAVASIFALRLAQEGHERAQELVPVTFLVIVGTVSIYGLTSGPLARWLGLSRPNPQGVLFVGAHPLARSIAKLLHQTGFSVLLADTNWDNLSAARLAGLPVYFGNVLSERARDELELTGIGRLVAFTSNHEVNTLGAIHFIEYFGRSEIYQVQTNHESGKKNAREMRGRVLFGKDIYLDELTDRVTAGAVVRKTTLTKEFNFATWQQHHGWKAVPLFLFTEGGNLKVFTEPNPPVPAEGQTLLALTYPNPPAGAKSPEAASAKPA